MEDVIGKTDFELYPPELAENFTAIGRKVIDSGIPILNYEEPGLDALGKPVRVLSSKVPLRDGQGKIMGLVGIGRDITEIKRTEEQIKKQLSELQRWYDLTLDRETRTLELKKEVNDLLHRLNEPPRYASAEE